MHALVSTLRLFAATAASWLASSRRFSVARYAK
jgi:hypothetical protein